MGPFPWPSSRCPAYFSCSVRHPSAPPAGAPFLFHEAGCLCVETKPVTFAVPFFVTRVPPAALADGQNHGSFRGLGEQQRARQETPRCCQPTRVGQAVGRGGLLSLGKDTVRPWRRGSDMRYAPWSRQPPALSGTPCGNPLSQKWAVWGWL